MNDASLRFGDRGAGVFGPEQHPQPSSLLYLFAMTTTASSFSNILSRPTYSCIRCALRKVKSDRHKPCSACVRHNVDCVFHPSQSPRKRKKRVKVQMLTSRSAQTLRSHISGARHQPKQAIRYSRLRASRQTEPLSGSGPKRDPVVASVPY